MSPTITSMECGGIFLEFNMEHLIFLIDEQCLKMQAIFESIISASRSKYISKGYQQIFPKCVSSLKEAASTVPPSGTIDVDLGILSVIHIWPEVKGIIINVRQFMNLFLKLFGV